MSIEQTESEIKEINAHIENSDEFQPSNISNFKPGIEDYNDSKGNEAPAKKEIGSVFMDRINKIAFGVWIACSGIIAILLSKRSRLDFINAGMTSLTFFMLLWLIDRIILLFGGMLLSSVLPFFTSLFRTSTSTKELISKCIYDIYQWLVWASPNSCMYLIHQLYSRPFEMAYFDVLRYRISDLGIILLTQKLLIP